MSKQSAEDVSARIAGYQRKTANFHNDAAEDASTHITIPQGRASDVRSEHPSIYPETAAGDFSDEPQRPQSMTEDAWILAGRRAAKNPATADVDFVRAKAVEYIGRAGRGSQSELADATGIPGGTLSKFLHRGGPLSDAYCSKLVRSVVAAGEHGRARTVA